MSAVTEFMSPVVLAMGVSVWYHLKYAVFFWCVTVDMINVTAGAGPGLRRHSDDLSNSKLALLVTKNWMKRFFIRNELI